LREILSSELTHYPETLLLDTFQVRSVTIGNHIMPAKTEASIPPELRRRFTEARRVCVLTGAGVSAESGVPTFRGGGGAEAWQGMPLDVIASAEMVERDLKSVWEWFDLKRDLIGNVHPNPAHDALARWQDLFKDFTLVTQNVDGLHQAAGSREVIELHGNIWRAKCISCSRTEQMSLEHPQLRSPHCLECGDEMRPDIVLFGELLPMRAFARASMKAEACELFFVVGTSALVYPAASLPEIAQAAGAYLVEINPEPTPLSAFCDAVISGRAGEVLPQFDER
jgi:NAD-dependent deacetylase